MTAILVRGPNWLGDLVMCTPAFRALRAAFPDAHLALHARAELLPVLDGAPWFDSLLPLHSRRAGGRALWSEGRRLRAERRWDLGICIPDSWSSALLMRAAGVRRVVGFRRGGRDWLLHDALDPLPGAGGRRRLVARERHALALAEAAGAPPRGTGLELFVTAEEETRARARCPQPGLLDRDFVALAPGASYGSAKRWPAASFAAVGDVLLERGLGVCLIGAPGEEAVCAEVAAAMQAPPLDLGGRLDPGALKALLSRARALVCNDAGARHVAVALGVPSVVLMGPTSLAKTDCNLERVRIVETDVVCRPCYARDCPIDHRCMTRLEPEDVLRALAEPLGTGTVSGLPGARRRDENAGP